MLLFLACTGAQKPDPVDPADTAPPTDDTGTPPASDCPAVPTDAPWQAWDDGDNSRSLYNDRRSEWAGAEGDTYNLYETPGWEAVRFEISDPTCLYAFRVYWKDEPAEGARFGLYTDFGWNGMDFHPDQPLWEGDAAAGVTDEEGWTTYTLSPPVRVEGPALVWGASYRDGEAGPVVFYDGGYAGDGGCAVWDDCHSALNYPDADARTYYNGSTFPWPYDFLMRVQYSVLETIADEDLWFHDSGAGISAGHGAWGDYDDDGDDDLMVPGLALWRNDNGGFTDVTAEAGVTYASGGVWGDYDNDGCLDFFGFNEGYTGNEALLHSNCDGTFTDLIAQSGIDDTQTEIDCVAGDDPETASTAGAAWIDFDADGFLDLALANHICWGNTSGREEYYPDRFFHNEGDGTFVEWGEEHGLGGDSLATRGAMGIDADMDGDVDLAMNNYRLGRNYYYRNDGGTFEEVGRDVGLSGDGSLVGSRTYYGHTIGMAWGDLDNDGDFDAVAANLAHPRYYDFSDKTDLLINEGGVWVDEWEARGIRYHETHSNPSLLDFENDGDLDLVITEVYDGRPTDVYVNDGAAYFGDGRRQAGITTENGWGSAVADYDGDGDEDLLATTLFRNDVATGHFVQIRVVGDVTSNWAAIGATVWVLADGKTYVKAVPGGSGTGNQDSLTLTFGLGDATVVDSVTVMFPGGNTVWYAGIGVDAGWRLTESGTVTEGLGAP